MLCDSVNLMYLVIPTPLFPNPLSVLFWYSENLELWSLVRHSEALARIQLKVWTRPPALTV